MLRARQAAHDEQNMPKHLSGLQQQNASLELKFGAMQQRNDALEQKVSTMQRQFGAQLQQLAAHNAQHTSTQQLWTAAAVGVQRLEIPAAEQTVRSVPEAYPTIQAAIDAADVGDRVLVAAGVYNEALRITQHVTIVGASRESTVVQINTSRTACCEIEGGSCMLANIQLKASGTWSEAIDVSGQCRDVLLVDCDLSAANGHAVLASSVSVLQNLVLRGCRLHHSINGLLVHTATTVKLESCIIEENTNSGVCISAGSNAMLSGCTVTRNQNGACANGQDTKVTILENNNLSGNRDLCTLAGGGAQIIEARQ